MLVGFFLDKNKLLDCEVFSARRVYETSQTDYGEILARVKNSSVEKKNTSQTESRKCWLLVALI